jgi:hypothetical protein
MDNREQEMVLLEIKEKLGKIDGATTAIQSDISELKQKDIDQSLKLEEAYAKAKARQDSIRDDLQHQIDNTQHLIGIINDNFGKSIAAMNENFSTTIKTFSDSTTKLITTFSNEMKESIKSQDDKIDAQSGKIEKLETKKEKVLVKWWDKIIDKLIWIVVIAAFVVLLKWLNAPPEIMNQLTH